MFGGVAVRDCLDITKGRCINERILLSGHRGLPVQRRLRIGGGREDARYQRADDRTGAF